MEQLKGILFIDIETVPIVQEYSLLPEPMQAEWNRKSKFVKSSSDGIADPATVFADRAGIFSEFAKVVCIGFGSLHEQDKTWKMRLKSLVNDDEKILLKDFCEVVKRFSNHYKEIRFCGHNIKEFDIPFLCRRMLINGIQIPDQLHLSGKKPWEVSHLDTLEMWKFGDYKNFTSLSLLAAVFGIPSPKGDIDGSQVATVYWNDKDLARIGRYCIQDVLTSAKVYLKLKGINDIEIEPIFITD
jgi:DNA polymerase elongation subunit (family B)